MEEEEDVMEETIATIPVGDSSSEEAAVEEEGDRNKDKDRIGRNWLKNQASSARADRQTVNHSQVRTGMLWFGWLVCQWVRSV